MKNLFTFFCAIAFSTLFYQQAIGLNLFLCSILTGLSLLIKRPDYLKKKEYILKLLAFLLTGIMVFMYNSALVMTSYFIAFFTLIGSSAQEKNSIYVNWLNGIYSSVGSYFSNLYDRYYSDKEKKSIDYWYWLKILGIPLIFILIFTALYRNSNPVFDDIIEGIDLSFINFQWIILSVLGYFVFFNISNAESIEPITSKDRSIGNLLHDEGMDDKTLSKLKYEKQLGLVLLSVLSLLILFFIGTDVIYLTKIYDMSASELSKQVHNGVDALIFSNVLAILIILYFFRGQLNFYNNKELRHMTTLWIGLNLIVIVSTVLKNTEYIHSFGLTYKRIGVLFFLAVTSVGLITTLVKVLKIKNLWYLFRVNLSVSFMLLILAATVNWDKLITYYNLYHLDVAEIGYVIKLSNNNAILLKSYRDEHDLEERYQIKIDEKYNRYVKELNENSWQELVYDNLIIKSTENE